MEEEDDDGAEGDAASQSFFRQFLCAANSSSSSSFSSSSSSCGDARSLKGERKQLTINRITQTARFLSSSETDLFLLRALKTFQDRSLLICQRLPIIAQRVTDTSNTATTMLCPNCCIISCAHKREMRDGAEEGKKVVATYCE